ncbi:hypothetical protein FisN_18Hh056 [Fistulifera solaris]|uniref:Uncharacterized protein n=1 Tax=Fistulifera solaris TaxID=1519565 RepID=A0A1Z5JUY8_FISSO|nr:hypothetical protein FisN_18Hh056 [Fistulifera solaris]|eukprot:GAX17853.1 hypothetical protein FisN_18Hh056 [Fistulifera solaris]
MHRALSILTTAITASIFLARSSTGEIVEEPRDLQIFSLISRIDLCDGGRRAEKCVEFGGIQLQDGVISSRRLDLNPGTSQNFCLSGLLEGNTDSEPEAIVQCAVTSRNNLGKLTLSIKDAEGTELCVANQKNGRIACVVTSTTDTIVANVASSDSQANRVQIMCVQDGSTACSGDTLTKGVASDTFDLAFGEIQNYCIAVASGQEVECKTAAVAGGDLSLWVAFGDVGNVPPQPSTETCFANQAGSVEESCKVSQSVGTIVNVQIAATKPTEGVSVTCT